MSNLIIRKATTEDVGLILNFIKELARFEKAEHEVKTDKEQLKKSLFGKDATAHAVICESDGRPVGYAVYFFNYSTWQGKNGLYIEDLYISPEHRHIGAGTKMLKHLSCMALERDCGRMEWSVLDWNAPAIGFYKSLGAVPQEEWIRYRLTGISLKQLANT